MPLNVCYVNSQNFLIPLRVSSFFILLHCCFRGCTGTNASAILFWGKFVAALFPRPIGSVMEPADAVGVCVCVCELTRRWATSREPRLSPSSHLTYVHGRAREGAFNNQGLIQIRCSFFPTLLPRGGERTEDGWWEEL